MKIVQQFQPKDRFLSISVYKFPLGNCGGITDSVGQRSIFIPCESGPYTYSEIEQHYKLELIFIPEHRGGEYWALKPMIQPVGMSGPMSGGNLAYSCDSRCTRVYHIHDRFE